jgi:DNA-binding NarL/FixJ family response regulator
VTPKPRILAACPPFAWPTIERVLGAHGDIVFVNSLDAARAALRTNREIAMVVCGVHFDESRMYELLEYAHREHPDVPFLCVRILDAEMPRISREALAVAAKALGALGMLDFATLVAEQGRSVAEQTLENEVLTHLRPNNNGQGASVAIT